MFSSKIQLYNFISYGNAHVHVDSLTDSELWLDAVVQNAWDTGLYHAQV